MEKGGQALREKNLLELMLLLPEDVLGSPYFIEMYYNTLENRLADHYVTYPNMSVCDVQMAHGAAVGIKRLIKDEKYITVDEFLELDCSSKPETDAHAEKFGNTILNTMVELGYGDSPVVSEMLAEIQEEYPNMEFKIQRRTKKSSYTDVYQMAGD
jgi:hypothetical protein